MYWATSCNNLKMKNNLWKIVQKICLTYHVVNILPVVQSDQLECCQHRPEKVIKTSEAVVGILADATKAHETMGTRSEF